MPAEAEPNTWDFLTLIAWWNLYGLPALLVVLALILAIRQRNRVVADTGREPSEKSQAHDSLGRLKVIRTIALIHLGLAVRRDRARPGAVDLALQGIPQSFPVTGIVIPAAALMVNLVIGHGLWRLQSWGRWAAIVWDALAAIIMALVMVWQWKFHVAVRPDQWPDYLVADVLPWYLLVVMLLPGTRSLFEQAGEVLSSARKALPGTGLRRLSWLWLLAVLLLIIVCSTLLVDATDWLVRLLSEPVE